MIQTIESIDYILRVSLLLQHNVQNCCHLLVRKVSNKIQEILHSKEYY